MFICADEYLDQMALPMNERLRVKLRVQSCMDMWVVYGSKHYSVLVCHDICYMKLTFFIHSPFYNLTFGGHIGKGFPAGRLRWRLGWWLQWWWRIAIAYWWGGPFCFLCGFNQRQVETVTLYSCLNQTLLVLLLSDLCPFLFVPFQIQPCKHWIHWGSRTLRRHSTFIIRPLPMVLLSMLNWGEWRLKRRDWRRQQLLLLLKLLMSCCGQNFALLITFNP